MLIVGILSWWYTAGWQRRTAMVHERILSMMDYFSIHLLFGTLFSPYRQISAGKASGSIGQKWRAFMDQLISRIIGAIVRIIVIIVGTVGISATALAGAIEIAVWAFIPLLPLLGVGMMLVGWTPSWN